MSQTMSDSNINGEVEAVPGAVLSILDILKAKNPELKNKEQITADDCWKEGVDLIGGCEICGATIAIYNAYLSHSGYWRCGDCIGDTGWDNIKQALEDLFYCSIDPKVVDGA